MTARARDVRPAPSINPDGTRGLEPREGQPKYIRQCFLGSYTLRLVNLASNEVTHVRTRCTSWRHEGPCQARRFFLDRDKILEGLKDTPLDDIAFVVFTLDPGDFDALGRRSARGEEPSETLPKSSIQMLTAMYRALRDSFFIFRYGVGSSDSRRRDGTGVRAANGVHAYASTVEVQRRGWPHLNAILVAPGLGKEARELTAKMRKADLHDKDEIGRRVARGVFGERLLDATGFGFVWADGAASAAGLATYVAKLGSDRPNDRLDPPDQAAGFKVRGIDEAQAGEMAKYSQVPYDAPPRTRRIHFSQHDAFWRLPQTDPEFTGVLLDTEGNMVLPRPPPEQADEPVREATPQELAELLAARVEKAKKPPPPELRLIATAAKSLMTRWGVRPQTPARNDFFREAMDAVQRVYRPAVEAAVVLVRSRHERRLGFKHPLSEAKLFDHMLDKVSIDALVQIRDRLGDVATRRVPPPPEAGASNAGVYIGSSVGSDGTYYDRETGEVSHTPGSPGWREAEKQRREERSHFDHVGRGRYVHRTTGEVRFASGSPAWKESRGPPREPRAPP